MSEPRSKHYIIHVDVSGPPRVTSLVFPRETDWDMVWDLITGTQFLKDLITLHW